MVADFQSKGLIGVLYAMAFYAASVDDMKRDGIPKKDIDIILKATSQLTTVYKRLIMNETGWKKGVAGKFLTHGFCLGILKSSAVLVGNAIRKRRAQAMLMPPLETTNLNKIPKFPITSENMDIVTSDSDN